MSRAETARWAMLFVVLCTVASALAGSEIGVILGSVYVFAAVSATFIDMIERREDGEEDN